MGATPQHNNMLLLQVRSTSCGTLKSCQGKGLHVQTLLPATFNEALCQWVVACDCKDCMGLYMAPGILGDLGDAITTFTYLW